jgi:hypothetical protein
VDGCGIGGQQSVEFTEGIGHLPAIEGGNCAGRNIWFMVPAGSNTQPL